MSWYSLSTSTSSVGFTGTPLRARQRPPGGVGSVGYVEVAGHELLFDLWG